MYILQFVCLINDIVKAQAKDIFDRDNIKRRKALISTLNQSIKGKLLQGVLGWATHYLAVIFNFNIAGFKDYVDGILSGWMEFYISALIQYIKLNHNIGTSGWKEIDAE